MTWSQMKFFHHEEDIETDRVQMIELNFVTVCANTLAQIGPAALECNTMSDLWVTIHDLAVMSNIVINDYPDAATC